MTSKKSPKAPSFKQILFKDAFIYTAANYVSDFLGMAVALFSKRLLGVVGSGYWTVLSVIQSYGMYTTLGTKNALYREVPQSIGAKNFERAQRLQDAAFTYVLASGLLGAFLIWFSSFFLFRDVSLRWGTKITALLVLALQFYNLLLTLLRARKQFSTLAKIIVLNMVFVVVLGLGGAFIGNVVGYVSGLTIATVLSYLIGNQWGGFRFSLCFDWKEMRELLMIGLSMVIASVLLRTFLNMDKIMIGKMLGAETLGLYTVALMAVQQFSALPRFFSIAVFPHVQEKYGETRKTRDLKSIILKPTVVFTRLMPICVGGIIFLMEPLVHYVLPKFSKGMDSMKILLFGYFFVVLTEMASTLVFTIDKQNQLAVIYCFLIGVCSGLNYAFISMGLGLNGAAWATALSYVFFFLGVFTYAAKHLMGWKELMKFYGQVALFFTYFLVNILWIDTLIHPSGVITAAVIKLALLFLVSLPVLILIEREDKIFSMIFDMIRSKWAGPKEPEWPEKSPEGLDLKFGEEPL